MRIAKRSLIAAATVASASALALGAGAGTASANYLGFCAGSGIDGFGATFQTSAQRFWTGTSFPAVCARPVAYTGVGSGRALADWGFTGVAGARPSASTREYIATDDAPTATQIANAQAAAGAGVDFAIVPATQGAIAIVYNAPDGCTVNGNLTNAQLESVFRGNTVNWAALGGASGTCATPIRHVVRLDSSGTTFQFKQYLYRINRAAVAGTSTWQDLQLINSASPTPNQTWPGRSAGIAPIVPAGTGGGQVAATVAATDGSIGYVSLSDVGANPTFNLQNASIPSVRYASPRSGSDANCATALYSGVPTATRNADWSQVYGGNPNVGGTTYPICTLTYVIGIAGEGAATSGPSGYGVAGFAGGDAIATTVRDYFQNVIGNAPRGLGYAALPTTGAAPTVATAAANAAAEIW